MKVRWFRGETAVCARLYLLLCVRLLLCVQLPYLLWTLRMATLAARQRLLVLYGSQTGCAKETAEAFHRMGLRRCFDCKVYALDAYDWKQLPKERLVLFVVSTTGDGDPPDNMVAFWKFLLCD